MALQADYVTMVQGASLACRKTRGGGQVQGEVPLPYLPLSSLPCPFVPSLPFRSLPYPRFRSIAP